MTILGWISSTSLISLTFRLVAVDGALLFCDSVERRSNNTGKTAYEYKPFALLIHWHT